MDDMRRRWLAFCERTAAQGDPGEAFDGLARQYNTPPRAYHNLQHVAQCLQEFEEIRFHPRYPDEAEYALWFHDAVCDSRASDNEERSADLARSFGQTLGLPEDFLDRSHRLILATRHDRPAADMDEEAVVDADLSILAGSDGEYLQYERAIRQEFAWVPEADFKVERCKVLRAFLKREWIYWTASCRERHEEIARQNIRNALRRMGG